MDDFVVEDTNFIKLIRLLMRSQYKVLKGGVICCDAFVQVSIFAAAFGMSWFLFSLKLGRAPRKRITIINPLHN